MRTGSNTKYDVEWFTGADWVSAGVRRTLAKAETLAATLTGLRVRIKKVRTEYLTYDHHTKSTNENSDHGM